MKSNKFVIMVFALLVISIFSVSAVSAANDYAITSFSANPSTVDVGETVTFSLTVENIGVPDSKSVGNVGPAPPQEVAVGSYKINLGNGVEERGLIYPLSIGENETYTFQSSYNTYNTFITEAEISIKVPVGTTPDNAANNVAVGEVVVMETFDVPVIEEIENQVLILNEEWTYQVQATLDANLAYYNVSLDGMTISSTGLIRYTPNVVGTFPVTVTVTDVAGQSDTEGFTITVREDAAEINLNVESIILGGSNAERGTLQTSNVVIENVGTQTLTNFDLDLTTISGTESTLVTHSSLPSSLAPGATYTITLSAVLPEGTDGGEPELYGYFELKANSADGEVTSGKKNIFFEAESGLTIDEVELYVNGDKEETLDDGESFDEVKEGDEIKLLVKVENNWDFDMEDVFVELISSDSDWDFVEEESNEEDIDEGDDFEFELNFKIDPNDLDEDSPDSVTITVLVFGEDSEYNFNHYVEMDFELEIEREDDEITVTDVTVSQSSFTCSGGQLVLDVDFKNTGDDDQDESYLIIKSDDLDIDERYEIGDDFESKDDDSTSFYIDVPSNMGTGTYLIEIMAYNDDDDRTDIETVTIEVNCGSPSDDDDEDDEPSVIVQPPVDPYNGNFGEFVEGNDSFRNSPLYIGLLIVLAVLVIAGIVMLTAIVIKKN